MKRGFSLVELSIVLVILGLLTGGILAGQSLIRAAELRSIPNDYNRYIAATYGFRDKYFGLPGDLSNATQFWNRQVNVASCVTNSGATVTAPGTCDGGGNNQIHYTGGDANLSNEIFQYWRQMALAGLIEGEYSGLSGANGPQDSNSGNSPLSRLAGAGWSVWFLSENYAGDPGNVFAGNYGQVMTFGNKSTNSLYLTGGLKAEDVWNIDTKVDDGKPYSGRLVPRNYGACTNGSSVTDSAATYALSNSNLDCSIFFRNM